MSKKKRPIKLPQKRNINLAANLIKKTNWLLAIPAIILIIAGACAISKFFVVDQMVELTKKRSELAQKQAEVDALYAHLLEFEGVSDEYEHYTYSSFTDLELSYKNRLDVVNMIERSISPYAKVKSWNLTENTISITMWSSSLAEIKDIVARLEMESIVDYCEVKTAIYDEEGAFDREGNTYNAVSANVEIYLNTNYSGGVE